MDATLSNFLSVVIRYGIVVFAFVVALEIIGIQTTSILTVVGTAGLAVGSSLRNSLSNFASGLLLVGFRSFRIGDYVEIGGVSGTVQVVQIFATRLRTKDGNVVSIPNDKVLSGNIVNFSQESHCLLKKTISVHCRADVRMVKDLIVDVLSSDARVLRSKGIVVRLVSFEDAALNFLVRVWVPRRELQNAAFDIVEGIKNVFDRHDVRMPEV